jgi:hypothetical protein
MYYRYNAWFDRNTEFKKSMNSDIYYKNIVNCYSRDIEIMYMDNVSVSIRYKNDSTLVVKYDPITITMGFYETHIISNWLV